MLKAGGGGKKKSNDRLERMVLALNRSVMLSSHMHLSSTAFFLSARRTCMVCAVCAAETKPACKSSSRTILRSSESRPGVVAIVCLVEIGQRPVLRCWQGRDAVSSTQSAVPRFTPRLGQPAGNCIFLPACQSVGAIFIRHLCRAISLGGLWSDGISVRAIVIRHLCPGYIPTAFLSGLYLCLGGLWSYGISVGAISLSGLWSYGISVGAIVIRHLCRGYGHTAFLSGL